MPSEILSTAAGRRAFLLMGALLTAAAIAWTHNAARASGGDPDPASYLLLGAAGAFLVARMVTAVRAWPVLLAVIVVTAVLVLEGPEDTFRQHWYRGPLGYANANGALYVQAVAAAAMLFVLGRSWIGKLFGIVAAAGGAVFAFATGSAAAALLLSAMTLLIVASIARPRAGIAVAAGASVVAIATTTALGAAHPLPDSASAFKEVIDVSITERRVALWRDALDLMSAHPATGVGPRRFQTTSPTALSDVDARWGHNEFLQMGAETGVPGLVLLIALFGWVFASLFVGRPDAASLMAAAAVAAVAVQSSLDYILHFPAVPLASAALAGVASGRRTAPVPRRRQRPVPRSELAAAVEA